MQLNKFPNKHLTYCTNIHPGESWQEVFGQLKSNIPRLKSRIAPEKPFGIGLRLSAAAANQLLEDNHLQKFKAWLKNEDLYVFTMNGFPYGDFHGQVVKDRVYRPDWQTEARVDYTLNLAAILAQLLPPGTDGGISTSPLSYKHWPGDEDHREQVFRKSTLQLARVAFELFRIKQESGKQIHLDIEPEPDCLLENSRETIAFFEDWLFPTGSDYLSKKQGISAEKAKQMIQSHICVCYDTCHFAVEYEDPEQAISAFQQAGIRIGKTQISAALKVRFDESTHRGSIISRLRDFAEDTYLHQVIERRADGAMHQYNDLPEAFAAGTAPDAREWRIHYHVPIFIDEFDGLESTQGDITGALKAMLAQTDCRHFEIETYTWNVLPDRLKTTIVESIEREFNWTLNEFTTIASQRSNGST